jgi:hypothetical protein
MRATLTFPIHKLIYLPVLIRKKCFHDCKYYFAYTMYGLNLKSATNFCGSGIKLLHNKILQDFLIRTILVYSGKISAHI